MSSDAKPPAFVVRPEQGRHYDMGRMRATFVVLDSNGATLLEEPCTGNFQHGHLAGALMDHGAKVIVDVDEFVDAGRAAIAGITTMLRATRVVRTKGVSAPQGQPTTGARVVGEGVLTVGTVGTVQSLGRLDRAEIAGLEAGRPPAGRV